MKESEPASGNGDVSPLPWQQAAVVMYATGSTGREIAKVFDRTPQCVSGLCQHPWFQNRVAEILSEHSLSVLELFRAETVHCLQVLIEIMDDPDTPADDRDEDNFRRIMPAEKRRWGPRILRHLSSSTPRRNIDVTKKRATKFMEA